MKKEIDEDERGFVDQSIYNRKRFNKGKREFYKEYDSEFKPCMAFVIYERIDPENSNSPFFLKEFNPMHTHPLNLTKSFPTMWTEYSRTVELLS